MPLEAPYLEGNGGTRGDDDLLAGALVQKKPMGATEQALPWETFGLQAGPRPKEMEGSYELIRSMPLPDQSRVGVISTPYGEERLEGR